MAAGHYSNIGKEPGIHLPDKLCTILLMEADFNFPNKLFLARCMIEKKWKNTMKFQMKSTPVKDTK
jgi:hypothetical protein